MKEKISLFIAGDYCPVNRIEKLAEVGEVEKIFNDLLPSIKAADLSLVNLECVVTSSPEGIEKTGPSLKAVPQSLDVLKNAGFNMVTLANNHIMDYGKLGLESTIDQLKIRNIGFLGAGMNANEAGLTAYAELKGYKIALINICENEFSTTLDHQPGAHALNVIQNHRKIVEARQQADFVILIIHGGHEMYQLPSPRMKETYRFYADAGASVIINHHQHCYSGYEQYKEVPIFYGIGNFLFDQFGSKNPKHTNPVWNEGFCVKLEINNERLSYRLVPYVQNKEEAGVRRMNYSETESFESAIGKLNRIIENDQQLEEKFDDFCNQKKYLYRNYLEPFNNRFLRGLKKLGVLPYFFTKRKRRLYLNLVRCESHKDILLKVLKSLSS